jgi:hypothetical protein
VSRAEVPVRRVRLAPAYRLIPSRYPTVGLFDRVADPADLEAIYAIENLTNDRIRDEVGELALVPLAERISGPGTMPIMAAFTHLNPEGSRFSDGTWGVYYAGESFDTALAEVRYHRTLFLQRTQEPALEIDLRLVLADLDARLHDLRRSKDTPRTRYAKLLSPSDYSASQSFARRVRAADSWGIAYDSVRRATGQCFALFKPRALARARADKHISLRWDGARFTHWIEKGEPHALT